MSRLDEVVARQVQILEQVKATDLAVEALYDIIKQQDISEDAAARINAGLDAIVEALSKVETDDEPVEPEPTPEA